MIFTSELTPLGSTSDLAHFECFRTWLLSHNASGFSSSDVDFQFVEKKGLSCFAKKEFRKNDLIFDIPQKCILSYFNVVHSKMSRLVCRIAKTIGSLHLVTAELLIWLFMCQEHADMTSHFGPYLRTLSRDSCPSPSSWPLDLREALAGSNLEQSCIDVASSLLLQAELLDRIREWIVLDSKDTDAGEAMFPSNIFNHSGLIWARGHYLARRYPWKFANESQTNIAPESNTDTDNHCEQVKIANQEKGTGELGSLCPLLDILNHDCSEEWLRIVPDHDRGYLRVICNRNLSIGDEIFSNVRSLLYCIAVLSWGVLFMHI